jgi:hypothetical protein
MVRESFDLIVIFYYKYHVCLLGIPLVYNRFKPAVNFGETRLRTIFICNLTYLKVGLKKMEIADLIGIKETTKEYNNQYKIDKNIITFVKN